MLVVFLDIVFLERSFVASSAVTSGSTTSTGAVLEFWAEFSKYLQERPSSVFSRFDGDISLAVDAALVWFSLLAELLCSFLMGCFFVSVAVLFRGCFGWC